MKHDVVILVAHDGDDHVRLIEKKLRRAAPGNRIEHVEDGRQILDFLFGRGDRKREWDSPYLLLPDIRMPKVDGVEVLSQLKQGPELGRIPAIMLTTTDEPREVERCHSPGCSNYILKTVHYDQFAGAISRMGNFITLVRASELNQTG